MHSPKIALARARQIRRCPPHALLKDPDRSAEMNLHLALCPHCLDTLDNTPPMKRPEKTPAVGNIAPGQIRGIRSELAGWREGYHYNPPAVIVIEVDTISGRVRVAQTHDDALLAGPGDLILSDSHSGAGALFIETWNVYSLGTADLGVIVGQARPGVVEAVLRMASDPGDTPPWAPLPVPMKQEDIRHCFRELEVKTACFFVSRAAGPLKATMEAIRLRMAYPSLDELLRDIGRKVPGIRFPSCPASLEDALATSEFPSYALPLAAADDPEKTVIGKRAVFEAGILAVYEPVEIAVFQTHCMEDGRVGFSGRFPVHPETLPVHLIFRYAASNNLLIEPAEPPYWDQETGAFSVVFDTPDKNWRQLRVAIVSEKVQGS